MPGRCFGCVWPSAKAASRPTFVDLPATAAALAKDPAAMASMRMMAAVREPLVLPVLDLLGGVLASAGGNVLDADGDAEPPCWRWKAPSSTDLIQALCDSEVLSAWLRTPEGERALVVRTTSAAVLAANPEFASIENAVASASACQALLKCADTGRYFTAGRIVLLRALAELAAAQAADQECMVRLSPPSARDG